MKRLTKVAVLGAALDPITKGHAFIAKVIAKCPDLVDEVWLMPAYKHRFDKQMAQAEHRLAMARLVFPDHPKIKVSDYEIQRHASLDGTTYHTMLWLVKTYPECEFHVAIGTDNANDIDKFAHWEELVGDFPFIIVPRGGVQLKKGVAKIDYMEGMRHRVVPWYAEDRHTILKLEKEMTTSSTDARAAIKAGDGAKIAELLHPEVWAYIQEHGLYGASKELVLPTCQTLPTTELVSESA